MTMLNGLHLQGRAGSLLGMIRTPVLLEAFWPSRRIMQFDEFCRPAA
ncbi:hypothetical protein [Pseudonocardia alaniniphila]|uniref:Uncharacterized protein n=1 Tax=Pseudonocardia alaniniphila TaxID=75291 RepID=A0ABS9TEQ4_9PSEU|nr:hypothetical protein [Pseudonocardia alaniniphila]MCH6166868.1 hypothetical protein [Pseudonocardia alaniniphila]